MRTRALLILMAVVLAASFSPLVAADARPAHQYSRTYFGDGNLPPGCIADMGLDNPDNTCHHMRTGLNSLDAPQVDVLVMVPVSLTAERDMRIMRQSVEMWEAGIGYLANEMRLGWLAEGMDFHITVDYVDATGEGGGEFTTYPIVDPEIVVIATNPVGGAGIGIDPLTAVFGGDAAPCTGLANPLAFEAWEALPGFDNHHEQRTGTYTEDCGGAGGDICFAVNGAIDPEPGTIDFFQLFDLVSHEFGHCLTLGHVGDGSEGKWGVLPSNDIMAYSQDPPGLSKCVSTLDIEGFALTMSRYLDVDGDGAVTPEDQLFANDQAGDGLNPFQVQHPDDHVYASSTGSPLDCPQPDVGPVPGPRTQWTPTPVDTRGEPVMTVTGPDHGAVVDGASVAVTGTVDRVVEGEPTEPTGSYDDAVGDASTAYTDISSVDVEVTDTTLEATISLVDLWPTTDTPSGTEYSITVDGRRFSSFGRYPTGIDANPMTWDDGAPGYMDPGTSEWDLEAKTVSFHLPLEYLAGAGITSPFEVSAAASYGTISQSVEDDVAPETGETIAVASSAALAFNLPSVAASTETVELEHEDGNVFFPEDSTLGADGAFIRQFVGLDSTDTFALPVEQVSMVDITLAWSSSTGGSDLDMFVTGTGVDSESVAATAENPETFTVAEYQGTLEIAVQPYLIADTEVSYTLVAEVTPVGGVVDADGDGVPDIRDRCAETFGVAPSGCPDTDGDGVLDEFDTCPEVPGNGADGCPVAATERVLVYVDDVLAGGEDVDTSRGPDAFSVVLEGFPPGEHMIRIDWVDDEAGVVASRAIIITRL